MVQTDFEYSQREYIKLNRKILKWEWYSDPNTRALFIHCLLKAKWRPGKWHGYAYQRGQFITSLSTLSVELGLSVQSIRTALNRLKSTGELTDWHDAKIRIITVVNYDRYQSDNRPANSPPTSGQQPSNSPPTGVQQQLKNNKNIEEKKEEKEEDSGCAASPSGLPEGFVSEEEYIAYLRR